MPATGTTSNLNPTIHQGAILHATEERNFDFCLKCLKGFIVERDKNGKSRG